MKPFKQWRLRDVSSAAVGLTENRLTHGSTGNRDSLDTCIILSSTKIDFRFNNFFVLRNSNNKFSKATS